MSKSLICIVVTVFFIYTFVVYCLLQVQKF